MKVSCRTDDGTNGNVNVTRVLSDEAKSKIQNLSNQKKGKEKKTKPTANQ